MGVKDRVAAVGLLLLLHAALLTFAACRHTPVPDEIGAMPAGIRHWKDREFDLYPVNPPLIRLVATIPAALANVKVDWSPGPRTVKRRDEYLIGAKLIRMHGRDAVRLFTLARAMIIPFSLLGAYFCYRWARELYGDLPGIVSLTLWCFCPDILAHGHLFTTDVGAAAVGLMAFYFFWKWLSRPSWGCTLVTGVAFGLAELTKTTWIVLFLLWPLLWVLWNLVGERWREWRGWVSGGIKLIALLILGLILLNLGYACEGSFQKLGEYKFISAAFSGHLDEEKAWKTGEVGNRFGGTWWGGLPMPVPQGYLRGIDAQQFDFERGMWSYLRGEWRTRGWWYYYLYGLLIKEPLGDWALLLLAFVVRLAWPSPSVTGRDELLLLSPALVVLVLVSSQTGFSHHLRYVLPMFPYLFIWISQAARAVVARRRVVSFAIATAWTWSVVSSLWIFPHSLSYFNESAGGPLHGHGHLLASNIDWGQDLHYLKRWLDKHPEASPLGLAYDTTFFEPSAIGIEYGPVPGAPLPGERLPMGHLLTMGPQPGWYAISVTALHSSQRRRFAYFGRVKPVALAGYSIYVYHLTVEETNRVRRESGLPELPAILIQ